MLDAATSAQATSTVALGNLVERVATLNPSTKLASEHFTYVDLSAVDQNTKTIDAAQSLLGKDAPSRARQIVRSGDVLVSTVRPNLNGVALVSDRYDGAIASTGFCVLRAKTYVLDANYLFHWVRSPSFVESMVSCATGASYPAVSDAIIRNSSIPLPPLPEQRRIAAILDQADALRAKRRAALAQLNEMAQAVFLDMFGDPLDNLRGWPTASLRDILLEIEGGWSPVCLDRSATELEWGILKLGSVTKCSFDDAQNKALPETEGPRPHLQVEPGDLLFSRKNTIDLVAACAYVERTRSKLMIPDLIFRLRIRDTDRMDARFLHALLTNHRQRRAIQSLAAGSAGSMPNISKARLANVSVIHPNIEMQRKFAGVMRDIGQLKAQIGLSVKGFDAMFASLQHRAFTGAL